MKIIKTIQNKNKNDVNRLKIAILSCVHGNENYSLKIFKRLKKINLLYGTLNLYLVNELAHKQNKRFIDTDLNRSFNLNKNNKESYEINLSKQIITKLKKYDYIIDMHSTTSKTNPFLIYINKELEKSFFLNSFNICKKVYIPNAEFSLIGQFKNAISIEISISNGYKSAIKNGTKYIESFLTNLKLIDKKIINNKYFENYICIGTTNKNSKLKDFKLTKTNNKYFYPMLSGEVSYTNLKCFKLIKQYK